MKPKEFKKKFHELKTWGEAERLLKQLTARELQEFISVHEKVKAYTGLNMRQDFYLSEARFILKYDKKRDEQQDKPIPDA